MAERTFRARLYGASILPGLRLLRLLVMNRQNASISATWSSERRTASASDRTPSALLARCRARGSTKNAFRVSARDLRIVGPRRNSIMHTSCRDRHTERFGGSSSWSDLQSIGLESGRTAVESELDLLEAEYSAKAALSDALKAGGCVEGSSGPRRSTPASGQRRSVL